MVSGKNADAAGRLVLAGLGISDEKGISLRTLEELRQCERLFAETYTNALPDGTVERLEKLVGKKITVLSREQVEGEKLLLGSARIAPTALIVPGDPMIATTHVSLALSAKKLGIRVEILHAPSILSAAMGESGLQAYKFGKTVTLAYWRKNYEPMAAYDVIAENLSRGLHTLLLLDIDEKPGPMKPEDAAGLLLEMEKRGGKKILPPHARAIVLQGVGGSEPCKAYSSLEGIASGKTAWKRGIPAVFIIPAKLHFMEEEFLNSLEQAA